MRKQLIALSTLALIVGMPLAAQDLVIQYGDLHLESEKGRKSLERRIDAAARDFCGMDAQRTGSRIRSAGSSACYSDARKIAREQMAGIVSRASDDVRKGG